MLNSSVLHTHPTKLLSVKPICKLKYVYNTKLLICSDS